MPITTTSVLPGFRIAMADATGAKTSQETLLAPGPTKVEYPNSALGEIIETADGRVVVQASNRDARRRSWLWMNYGPIVTTYERQHRWLQQLTARYRLAKGLSPYVYIYDGETNLLNYNRSHTTNVTNVSGSILTIPSLPGTITTARLANAVVEVLPATSNGSANPFERRSVLSATSTTLTLSNPLTSAPNSSNILITWSEPVWWKARVLDTTRDLREEGGLVRYTTSRFVFVIDEEMPI